MYTRVIYVAVETAIRVLSCLRRGCRLLRWVNARIFETHFLSRKCRYENIDGGSVLFVILLFTFANYKNRIF